MHNKTFPHFLLPFSNYIDLHVNKRRVVSFNTKAGHSNLFRSVISFKPQKSFRVILLFGICGKKYSDKWNLFTIPTWHLLQFDLPIACYLLMYILRMIVKFSANLIVMQRKIFLLSSKLISSLILVNIIRIFGQFADCTTIKFRTL